MLPVRKHIWLAGGKPGFEELRMSKRGAGSCGKKKVECRH